MCWGCALVIWWVYACWDLPTEGGRDPVSRTLLNHPVSYARQNPEFSFPALALDCYSAGFVVPVQDSCLARSGSADPPEFRFLPLRWTATLRGSSCQYRIAV